MKKTVKHMTAALALLLVLTMSFLLTACGEEESAATQTPAATQAPTTQSAENTQEPEVQPSTQPETEEGVFVSASKGFRFSYDPAYIAVANPTDNAMIYPTGDVELPFCSVSLIAGNSAVDYLKEMSVAAQEELGDSIRSLPGEPEDAGVEGRQIYSIRFSYDSFEVEGVVVCTYYAEDLASGDIVVYNATALEGDTELTDKILETAIDTFRMD